MPKQAERQLECICWNADFSSGHLQIDIDHRTLIVLFNDAVNASNRGVSVQMQERLRGCFEKHVDRHLCFEENLLKLKCVPEGCLSRSVRDEFLALSRLPNGALKTCGFAAPDMRLLREKVIEHIKGAEHICRDWRTAPFRRCTYRKGIQACASAQGA